MNLNRTRSILFSPVSLPVILLFLLLNTLHGQPFRDEIRPFDVAESSGELLLNPFAGGLDLTRIGLIDVDGDSDPDLFTLNTSERLRFYRNLGERIFRRERLDAWESVPLRSWFRIADIDGDGDMDLFTSGERSELMMFRNQGTTLNPEFAAADTVYQSDGSVIYSEQQTVPTFADIDGDNDPDLFSGNVDGTITFYENVGTRQVPSFTFRSRKFEGLLVLSPAGTEREKEDRSTSGGRHGASVLDFVDLDGDQDLDILFGDFFTKKLLHFENRGTRFVPDFDTLWVDSAFAPNGDVVESEGFNQAASADIDGDGDFDVFVSSLLPSAVGRPVELYINQGNKTVPLMRLATTNPTSEIDVGRFASPAWLEDDERQGLLIGSEEGAIVWYEMEEQGGKTRLQQRRRFFLSGVTVSAPAAGDLDGDGRSEVVVGKGDATGGTTLQLYRFEGEDFVRVAWQLDTTFNIARSSASPALGDIDGDEDLDLLVGARSGRFYLFRNIGTPTSPLFEVDAPPAPFDTLDLGSESAPRFADLDGDLDLDIIAGSRQSDGIEYDTIRFWLNEGGVFQESPLWPPMAVAHTPVPLLLDLAEGRYLIVGTRPGGLLAFLDTASTTSVREHVPTRSGGSISFLVSTDGNHASLLWSGIEREGREVVVVDLLGGERGRFRLEESRGERTISLGEWPAGIYFWREGGEQSGSFILIR